MTAIHSNVKIKIEPSLKINITELNFRIDKIVKEKISRKFSEFFKFDKIKNKLIFSDLYEN